MIMHAADAVMRPRARVLLGSILYSWAVVRKSLEDISPAAVNPSLRTLCEAIELVT